MTHWLIDKSALVRLDKAPDAADWAERISRGLVRISTVTRLEVGWSVRTPADARAAFRMSPLSATAELAGLTVLHVDKDFDLVAEVTGQPTQRLELG